MKKLTGALVLSFSLLLTSACRSSGETRDTEDASTASASEQHPSPAGAVDTAKGALSGDTSGTPSSGAVQAPPGVNLDSMANNSGAGSGMATGASKDPAEGPPATSLSEAERAAQESCLDTWLKSQKLDRYGHPEGTMYAGGTPLFNEATGESTDRLVYVYKRQPEAKQACANAGKAPAKKK
jgi:hypothetical protein